MAEEQDRPEPDVLLEEAKKEGRGRLKVFLGAYPGVGKTYSMLEAAQARRREGLDVVVAVVETHGRKETERLLHGLDVVPRKQIGYRGRVFGEMDIDALLQRKPRLAIVDELAHSNVEGSRHVKRWQDVEELLAAGIDVYTTLNIQHLESLNDVVARISRVRVRETLPDKVLELADEIELIDLPPDDLIQRLREGKVYVRDQIGRAIRHFFSKGNLTAFRELAMRVAAERVDAQMINFMRTHAIPGPWPAQERLLVCINESPMSKQLVRTARRMAERSRIPWIVVNAQTPHHESLPDAAKDRIADALRLAESLGGEVVTLPAESDLAGELIRLARSRNVTRIVLGRPRKRHWAALFRENVAGRLMKEAKAFEVTIVSPVAEDGPGQRIDPERPGGIRFDRKAYGWATVTVAVATAIAFGVEKVLPLPNISLVFMTAVLFVATRFGLWPSLYTCLVSFLTYNYFFTVPYFTLSVSYRGELLTIVFFLVVAVLAGNLAARLKAQVEAMRTTAQRTANLFDFSRRIVAAASLYDVLWAAVHHVASTLQCQAIILLPKRCHGLEIAAGYPPEDHLSSTDRAAADWAWKHGATSGWGSGTLPAAGWQFLPLKTQRGLVGVLGISFKDNSPDKVRLEPEQHRLLNALVDQVAVAIERTNLATDIEEARVLTETEQLRSALLSSVSHDLRTPLVSIIGSATTLSSRGGKLSDDDRDQLVQTILEEGERLNRFVQNLLDMTRLGYGALQLNREWTDLREIAGRAVRRLEKLLQFHRLELDVPADLPSIRVDPVLIEQVLVNLLDNSAKYAPRDSRIMLRARQVDNTIATEVCDEGPGIPPDARDAVFEVFYRVRAGDRQAAGTGLGLSICRGLVEAHGGRIVARAGPADRGTVIEFTLPLEPAPPIQDETKETKDMKDREKRE
jgi:two-component system sensor histidine kinase KdpD